jgi:hypothetical protein
MADTIIDGTNFNASTIRYSAVKASGSGGKSINILNSSTKTGVRIATPLMLTWGVTDFQDPSTGKGNGKFDMSLQFPSGEYKTADATAFLENMIAFENKIKEDALANSKEWFGKVHKSQEVVDALYSPMLKYPKDKSTGEADLNKAPTLRVKIPTWEGVWKCEVYDEDGEKLFPSQTNSLVTPIDLIQKGTNVVTLIQCGGLWFANGKFGVTWKLVQVIVQKPKATLQGTCFLKLKPEDKERIKSSKSSGSSDLVDDDNAIQHTSAEAEDSESEKEEEAVVPEPAVVKKKKLVKKKTVASD